MASIKLILRVQQADATGSCPLYIRLIKDRKSKLITTGVKLKPKDWDGTNQRVKKSMKNSARLNAYLDQKVADASAMIADSERRTKSITAKKLKEAIKGKDSVNFMVYAKAKLKKLEKTYTVNTYDNYYSQLLKFEKFVDDRDFCFHDIDIVLLQDYMNYMANTLKNNKTTQKLAMIVLSIIFKQAQAENLIDDNHYPFSKLKLEVEPSKRKFLTIEQFEKLRKHKIYGVGKAELYRDLFVFAVSAGGLRFSDVVTLRWKDYDKEQNIINKQITKTKRMHRLKIGEIATKIIQKYKLENPDPEELLFPAIKQANFHQLSDREKDTIITSANRLCAAHLKNIGEQIELPFNLSFHLSRHTFATMALNKGMRIEHVSKLMDHAKISTTQIYAKIIDEELDKAVDEFVI
ncbi:site-specific integrase [Chryseobacterium sp.]|uniref:site-specific integrase n=1 Tax=Chryseobacterium sp. TaxID=1871047 RepID=UPI00289FB62A|nr:site-specific integrase [Chryseobacterium sp.]